MNPASGWYPDPTGASQLRFWDGQTWTTATTPAAPPGPQQYAQSQYTQPQYTQPQYTQQYAAQPISSVVPGFPRHSAGGRSKSFYGRVAAGAVAVVVVVAAVPFLLTKDHHSAPPTNASLTASLLTVAEINSATGSTFAPDTSEDNSSSNDNSADCPAGDALDKASVGAEKASADRSFASAADRLFVEESMSYLPGKGAALMTQLKGVLARCHTIKIGGTLTLTVLPAPPVPAADDSLAYQLRGTASGVAVTVEVEMVRFGDTTMSVYYGGRSSVDSLIPASETLTQAAAKKVKRAL